MCPAVFVCKNSIIFIFWILKRGYGMYLVMNLMFYSLILMSNEILHSESDFFPVYQLTYTTKNHELDNNDNFSYDDRFLCYDTRGTLGYGIENCISIEIVEVSSGKEYKVYQPEKIRIGTKPAPGVGAVSFHPKDNSLIFIHGPDVHNVNQRAFPENTYAKINRRGCIILIKEDTERTIKSWVDFRTISCEAGILSGSHRGGTHRHEYSLNGERIGCTYDDWLLPHYGRTIAYFEKTNKFVPNAEYYFAVLVKVVPMEKAKEGEFVKALGDSWVGVEGKYRAFVGTVKEGESFVDYLCVVEIPDNVDIQSSTSGDCKEYPEPPKGIRIHKITKVNCSGIVRGSYDGKKIAYLDKDVNGRTQIFMITADKQNLFENITPVQITHFPDGVEDNLRWHPSGNTIFSISEGAVVAICAREGENFGKFVFITDKYKRNKPYSLIVSRFGKYVAFNRCVPTYDERGMRQLASDGKDFSQIFLFEYKDENSDDLPDIK